MAVYKWHDEIQSFITKIEPYGTLSQTEGEQAARYLRTLIADYQRLKQDYMDLEYRMEGLEK